MDKLNGLGIDIGSFIFYLVNTGLLLIVLTYFLYKPILKFMKERQKLITDSIDESKKLQETFQEELDIIKVDRQVIESELRTELANLQKFTEKKRAELVQEMEKKKDELMTKAHKEIEEEKARLIKDAEVQVKKIIARIVLEIVENKVPENIIEDSIQSAWKTINK